MNLIDLTEVAKYVQSNKGKRSVVITSVRANELAEHEAHVGLERKVLRRFSSNRICHSSRFSVSCYPNSRNLSQLAEDPSREENTCLVETTRAVPCFSLRIPYADTTGESV